MSESQALELKKLTLIAWTNHFFSKGIISMEKRQKMLSEIRKLKK